MPLKWSGGKVSERTVANLTAALAEIGLRIEGAAKQELQPGHGVETGTLRRSIHAADVTYNFAGDDTEPSASTPDLGGQEATPTREGDRLMMAIGSGLNYALWVHQGHHSFPGYHFITNALEKVQPLVMSIVKKHRHDG